MKELEKKVIIDGDWGGDEMQLAAVLLADTNVKILGVTCVFGNTSHTKVVKNARNILNFLKSAIKVYPGASQPSDSDLLEGDDAHGADGIGNVDLAISLVDYETKSANDFIIEQLNTNHPKSITILASGPLTNIAKLVKDHSRDIELVKELIIMGGCTDNIKAHDMPIRSGNITPYAEFNFQQAPKDAQTVMESGLPIVLLPMNCTHQLTLTQNRQELIQDIFANSPEIGEKIIKMISAPAALDLAKFDSAPVMHDINCSLYLLYPNLYEVKSGEVVVTVDGDMVGHTNFTLNDNSNIKVAHKITDPDKLFDFFIKSLKGCFELLPIEYNQDKGYGASLEQEFSAHTQDEGYNNDILGDIIDHN